MHLRNKDLARIHALAKELGLDEETRRAAYQRITGKTSASAMTCVERSRVIDDFFRKAKANNPSRAKRGGVGWMKKQLGKKITALLLETDSHGQALGDAYGDAMAVRMFGIEKWEWLDVMQLQKLVAALAIHQRRSEARKEAIHDQ